ncbi:zinc finger protein ZAT3-like [Nymphaea colorata]|uniref:C2H2-type domain-containing protein n=1 Tax=Nymphaea colorata TaxID=210225 RepID=A0A5K1GUH1_9MAGN|nr:zinc finger protein ZAT3-like [Nymphaea colorata]
MNPFEQQRQPSLESVIATPLDQYEEPKKRKKRKRSEFPRPATTGKQFCQWDIVESSATEETKPAKRPYRQKAIGIASGDPAGGLAVHPCTECGKRFWSWKALFGHMRCHPERQWRGINPPPNIRRPAPATQPEPSVSQVGGEEEEVARCLVMLSTTSSADAGAGPRAPIPDDGLLLSLTLDPPQPSCRFECCTCNKVFGSHQALGGHRATHKNVKGCFARHGENEHGEKMIHDDGGGDDHYGVDHIRKMKVMCQHRCSECLKVFPSEQALDRHKRCHLVGNEPRQHCDDQQSNNGKSCVLDLNLPAPVDMEEGCSRDLVLDLKLGCGSQVGEWLG